ncbi:unnamed protein product, partial [Owenia fusiformis]
NSSNTGTEVGSDSATANSSSVGTEVGSDSATANSSSAGTEVGSDSGTTGGSNSGTADGSDSGTVGDLDTGTVGGVDAETVNSTVADRVDGSETTNHIVVTNSQNTIDNRSMSAAEPQKASVEDEAKKQQTITAATATPALFLIAGIGIVATVMLKMGKCVKPFGAGKKKKNDVNEDSDCDDDEDDDFEKDLSHIDSDQFSRPVTASTTVSSVYDGNASLEDIRADTPSSVIIDICSRPSSASSGYLSRPVTPMTDICV